MDTPLARSNTVPPIEPAAAEALAATLHAPLYRPGEEGFDSCCHIWNGMIERRPALVARCSGTADIAAGVRFARDHELPVAVRGGGHNVCGHALGDNGLMLDLSGLRAVYVEPRAGRARVEPGATWRDLDRETQLFGRIVPGGIVSATGVAGFTLGGGFGWSTRAHGYAADRLVSADIVTADGEVRHADAEAEPELFWALRGGGGNFGAVTSFEFETRPLGPTAMAGLALWPLDRAGAVLDLFREITAAASEQFCAMLVLRRAPPLPAVPKEMHGAPVAGIAACHVGSIADGDAAMTPLKQARGKITDTIAPKPFTAFQQMFDAGQPFGRRNYWKSDYFDAVPPAMDEALIAYAADIPSPHSALLCMHLGGAAKRVDSGATAVGNRGAEFVANIQSAWEDPAEDDRNLAWTRGYWEALRPHSNGGVYVNFMSGDEGEARLRAAYGDETFRHLAAIKARYDPDNLFRFNQNIPPAGRV
ncbi:MAG: FAD-binding protein [Alphaproteobacteria bacterium]|jgi:FAD/FMN-containing dehydrogenase|nr:FAD-binding protein [Alphaproteobacteria bacterium]